MHATWGDCGGTYHSGSVGQNKKKRGITREKNKPILKIGLEKRKFRNKRRGSRTVQKRRYRWGTFRQEKGARSKRWL